MRPRVKWCWRWRSVSKGLFCAQVSVQSADHDMTIGCEWLSAELTLPAANTKWESGEGLSSPVSLSSVNLCHQDGKRAGHSPNQSVCLSIYWILTSSRHFIFFICSVSEGVATWLQRAALSSELPAVLMVFWPKKAPCWAWSWFLLVSAEGTILQPWGRCF